MEGNKKYLMCYQLGLSVVILSLQKNEAFVFNSKITALPIYILPNTKIQKKSLENLIVTLCSS